jgi:sec-independent protein translocase protein TatA
MTCLPFAFIDGVGAPEMVLIFVLVLVLFGGQKLPEFARGLGKTLRELKKAAAGVEDEFKRALEEDERKQAAAALANQTPGATTDQAGPHSGHEASHDPHHDYYDHDHHHGGEHQEPTHGESGATTPAASGDPAGPVAEKHETATPALPEVSAAAGTAADGGTPSAPIQPATPPATPAPEGQTPKAP